MGFTIPFGGTMGTSQRGTIRVETVESGMPFENHQYLEQSLSFCTFTSGT